MDEDNSCFCVEASNDRDAYPAAIERYFDTYDAVMDDAQKIIDEGRLRCVWVSEKGVYTQTNGEDRECWIYFWWSEATRWGEVFGRGTGYPADRKRILVNYRPSRPA